MLAPYLDKLRTGGWPAVAVFLAIALVTLGILSLVLKRSSPTHLTIGAALVMLLYLAVAAFLILASRVFVTPK